MSPRMSTRRARSASRASSKRSRTRRLGAARRRGRRGRRRRLVVIGLAAVVLLALGYGYANRDELSETILEVTLPLRHEDIIRQQAAEKELPPELIAAVIYTESRFRDQESHAGARGLMQITPGTADFVEEDSGGSTFETDDLSDPDINIRYGTYYLRYLLDKFDGNEEAALAAYNGGETNVAERWGGSDLEIEDIDFAETRSYVEDVLEKQDEYRQHYGEELGID